MSRRVRGKISARYFDSSATPPVKDDQQLNVLSEDNHSLLFKGHDQKTSETKNEKIIIPGNDGPVQFSLTALRQHLTELKPLANVPVRSLSGEKHNFFHSTVESLRVIFKSPGVYEMALAEIQKVFDDVKDVTPGTVASYFVGCFNDDKFAGPAGCNPKCTSSTPPIDGGSTCEDFVLIYSEGNFSALNEIPTSNDSVQSTSSHAYIYISDTDFDGFSSDNFTELSRVGISSATLIYGTKDGKYKDIKENIQLNQLPKKSDKKSDSDSKSNSSSTQAWAIAILVILIIILLLLVLYLYRRQYQ